MEGVCFQLDERSRSGVEMLNQSRALVTATHKYVKTWHRPRKGDQKSGPPRSNFFALYKYPTFCTTQSFRWMASSFLVSFFFS